MAHWNQHAKLRENARQVGEKYLCPIYSRAGSYLLVLGLLHYIVSSQFWSTGGNSLFVGARFDNESPLYLKAALSQTKIDHATRTNMSSLALTGINSLSPLPNTLASGRIANLDIELGVFQDRNFEYLLRVEGPSLYAAYGKDIGNETRISFVTDVPGLYSASIMVFSLNDGDIDKSNMSRPEGPMEAFLYRQQMNITHNANNEMPLELVQQSQTYTVERVWTKEYCSNGYWLRHRYPTIDSSSSLLAEQAGLPWLWHSKCCPTIPLMVTPIEMAKLLGNGIKVAYLGDSLMRTIFQAFIDIATNYSSPFPGISGSWCKKNVSKLVINGRAELSTFGDGCWSGGANLTTFIGNSNSTLTYYDRHHSGQSVNDILSETETLDWIFVNYGLHDIGMFTIEQFTANLRDRLTQLKSRRTKTGRPSNLVYVGLWAQNVARKPIGWKWSGSNTRASDFIKAMKEVSSELNVPFIDIYHMTLPVLDANRDGVHFNESVTRTIAMLMVKNMQESYSFAASN